MLTKNQAAINQAKQDLAYAEANKLDNLAQRLREKIARLEAKKG